MFQICFLWDVVEIMLPNEILSERFNLLTPFIPGILGRSQFLKRDHLTNTSSCNALRIGNTSLGLSEWHIIANQASAPF